MSGVLRPAGAPASFIAARSCHDADDVGTIVPDDRIWFAIMVRRVWPVKAAIAVEQYSKAKDRTARAYQRGDREPPSSVLRDLLLGNEGFRVMAEMARDNPPNWWINVQRALRIVEQFDKIDRS